MPITEAKLNQFLDDANLNFNVEMMPTYVDVPTGKHELGFVAVRTDTHQPLGKGGLSKGFTPIQNRDAFKVLCDMSQLTEVELVKAGSWGNGEGIYAQISLGEFTVGKDDRIGKFLSVVNSHDGTRGLQFLITPFRFFCQNQINAAIKNAEKESKKGLNTSLSIRHSPLAYARMDELMQTIQIVGDQFDRTAEIYAKLEQSKINNEYVKEVLETLFPTPSKEGREMTIWSNKMDAIHNRFHTPDGNIEKYSAWNLYNAIQGTLQHDSKNTITKAKSVLMGDIAKQSSHALSTVLKLCSSEHIPQSVANEIDMMLA